MCNQVYDEIKQFVRKHFVTNVFLLHSWYENKYLLS